jgi:hypothetical protein
MGNKEVIAQQMLYLPYGLSDSAIHTNIFNSYPPPLSSIISLLFHISFIHPIFILYFSRLLSLPLFHFVASIPRVFDYLSLLIAHSAPSFLSFRPIPIFSLLVPTSESRHYFSFSCTFPPQEFPLSYSPHTPCCTLIL